MAAAKGRGAGRTQLFHGLSLVFLTYKKPLMLPLNRILLFFFLTK